MAKTEKSEYPHKLVVISDTHFGSTVGLCPLKYTTLEGQEVKANKFQEWLHDGFCTIIGKVTDDGIPYRMLINGDVIEGNHHGTRQLMTPDPTDHVNMAVEFLEHWTQHAKQVWVTLGTECHVHNAEHAIAKRLGAVPEDAKAKRFAWGHLTVDLGGVRVSATHHISTASRAWTEGNGLTAAAVNEQIRCVRAGLPVPKVMLRGHRHVGGTYSDGSMLIAVSGAWQGITRHGLKAVPEAIPEPSVVELVWLREGLPLCTIHKWGHE